MTETKTCPRCFDKGNADGSACHYCAPDPDPIRSAAYAALLTDLAAAEVKEEAAFLAWLEGGQQEDETLDAFAVADYELSHVRALVDTFWYAGG